MQEALFTQLDTLLLHTTVSHQQQSPHWPAHQPLLGIAPDFHISNGQKYSKQSKTERILAPHPLTYIFNVQEAGKSYSWGWLVFVGLGLGKGGEKEGSFQRTPHSPQILISALSHSDPFPLFSPPSPSVFNFYKDISL